MSYDQKRVVEAIRAFEAGEIVVVTDDDGRENEGDLIVAAVHCTADKMAFIVRHTSGIVCTPMPKEEAKRLNLSAMVAERKFRSDLFYRLNVVPIRIPPLAERREDIIPLVMQFVDEFNRQYGFRKKLAERVLGRLHAVGDGSRFAHRGSIGIESHGEDPVHYLLENRWLPPDLEGNFERLAEALFDAMDACYDRAGDSATLRLHGDCHPGNILWRDDQAHFVDLDDCLSGPAVQDLWMLAGRREDSREPWRWLLEGYETFRAFDRRELHLVESLRTLRLLHYNAWIARRWHDPAFPAAFPWFEAPRHWESVITQMQEQLSALHEPPPDPT